MEILWSRKSLPSFTKIDKKRPKYLKKFKLLKTKKHFLSQLNPSNSQLYNKVHITLSELITKKDELLEHPSMYT